MAVLLCSAPMPCFMAGSCQKRDDIISYSFPFFPHDSMQNLAIFGDASVIVANLVLTVDRDGMKGGAGSALLLSPIKLWGVDSDDVKHEASFNTSFTMNIYRRLGQGGGLAFVIVPSLHGPPPGSEGGFLGLTNTTSKSTTASGSSFVAVELDTWKDDFDPDDNHIGLNIGSVVSDVVVSLSSLPVPDNITLAPLMESVDYTVWIDYNGVGHHIWVYMAVDGLPKPNKAYLDAHLNMSSNIPQQAFIGFTASTGEGHHLHRILSWNLTVEKLPDHRAVRQRKMVLSAVLGSAAATVVIISVAVFYFYLRYKALKMELKLSDALPRLPGTPKEFKYAMIRKATNNYDEARKLGKGGFGAVYRGTLRLRSDKTCQLVDVAVKKVTRNRDRGYDDFLAEVDVINRLRHRNVVPLVGWCYEKGELLLIYEYMPNGSLDQYLFEENPRLQRPILGWNTRYDIIMDVAVGLHYVHHEHEHMVIHRDIKASNIMLDSSFHGRLGDFGLARIVSLNKNSYTDVGVAGTWGFIAPEYSVCHKATRKTDVYAFGVLVLEIITGERALAGNHDHETLQPLTDWVWWVHREGRLLHAVDDKVTSTQEFDRNDATRLLLLGLACSNPNPSDRPSMAEIVQVIAKSVPPPDVPLVKPTFVWPPEGGIPMEFDDMMATSNLDWEDMSSNEALGASVPSEVNRRNARVGHSNTAGSAEEYYV
ncbi:probable L-type lectin-domain containing receptor kinase S.5 [Triticum aestivum]|nr:probable L-type lectin-domain containing receptor kinase S.5 [Triticum aestivum]